MDSQLERISNELLSGNRRYAMGYLEDQNELLIGNINSKFFQKITTYIEDKILYQYHINKSTSARDFFENKGVYIDLKSNINKAFERIENSIYEDITYYYKNIIYIFQNQELTNEEKKFMVNKESKKFDDIMYSYANRKNYVELENLNWIVKQMSYYYEFENNYSLIDEIENYLARQKNNYEDDLNEQIKNTIRKVQRKLNDNSEEMINQLETVLKKDDKKNSKLKELEQLLDKVVYYIENKYKKSGTITFDELKNIFDYYIFKNGFHVKKENSHIFQNAISKIEENGIEININETLKNKEKVKQDNNFETKKINGDNKIETNIIESNDKTNKIDTPLKDEDFISKINPNLLNAKLIFNNGITIPFKQYLKEYFAPYMPKSDNVILSNGANISKKQYIEEIVFSNAVKYGRNVENLINDTININSTIIVKGQDKAKSEENKDYQYYLNNIINILLQRRKDKTESVELTKDEKVNNIYELHQNIIKMNKSIKSIEEISKIFDYVLENFKDEKFENKIANDIFYSLPVKKFKDAKSNNESKKSDKIMDFINKCKQLEISFKEFKNNNIKDTETLDLLISSNYNLKENGISLLNQNISEEERKIINYNILLLQEQEEDMKKFNFNLEEALDDFNRKL